jgi:hypothetical protein
MAEILLYIVAKLLYLVFAPIGFLYAIPRMLTRMNIRAAWAKLRQYFFAIAISIDQKGNVVMQELFNDILIRPKYKRIGFEHIPDKMNYVTIQPYLFGHEDETISSVLGKNKVKGTLTWCGHILERILHLIDPGHSEKSIEHDESFSD